VRFLLALLALLLAAGCGGGDSSGGGEQAAPPAQTSAEPEAGPEAAAPKLEGTTLDGEQLTLGDFRGRPVLVNVWSSW